MAIPYLTAAIGVGLAVLVGIQSHRLSEEQKAHAETKHSYEQRYNKLLSDHAKELTTALDTGKKRYEAANDAATAATQQLAEARTSAGAVAAANDSLRKQADDLRSALARARRSNSATGSNVAGDADGKALDLFSGLFAGASAEAAAMAEYADKLYAGGSSCERQYDSLK